MGYFLTTQPENAVPPKSRAMPKTHTPGSRLEKRGHRYYQPETARWVNRDPIGMLGSINCYELVHNDPVGRMDYLGHFAIELTDIKFGSCGEYEAAGTFEFPTAEIGEYVIQEVDFKTSITKRGSGTPCCCRDVKEQESDHFWEIFEVLPTMGVPGRKPGFVDQTTSKRKRSCTIGTEVVTKLAIKYASVDLDKNKCPQGWKKSEGKKPDDPVDAGHCYTRTAPEDWKYRVQFGRKWGIKVSWSCCDGEAPTSGEWF